MMRANPGWVKGRFTVDSSSIFGGFHQPNLCFQFLLLMEAEFIQSIFFIIIYFFFVGSLVVQNNL